MFNLQFSEILIILALALILLGPEKLPKLAKKLGRLAQDLKATTEDLKRTWEREAWEAEEEVREVGRSIRAAERVVETDAVAREGEAEAGPRAEGAEEGGDAAHHGDAHPPGAEGHGDG